MTDFADAPKGEAPSGPLAIIASVDAAVVIIVGLFGGVFGALVTTLLRIRHEREEQLRERMITAADDFATGIFQVILGLRDAQWAALDHGRTDDKGQLWVSEIKEDGKEERFPEVDAAYREARRVVDEAHARYPRIQLLFGVGTRAEKAAKACVIYMRSGMLNLEAWPLPNLPSYNQSFTGLHEWQERFAVRAAEAIQGERWHQRLRAKLRRNKPPTEPEPDEPDERILGRAG